MELLLALCLGISAEFSFSRAKRCWIWASSMQAPFHWGFSWISRFHFVPGSLTPRDYTPRPHSRLCMRESLLVVIGRPYSVLGNWSSKARVLPAVLLFDPWLSSKKYSCSYLSLVWNTPKVPLCLSDILWVWHSLSDHSLSSSKGYFCVCFHAIIFWKL